jgi:hypothetical protein
MRGHGGHAGTQRHSLRGSAPVQKIALT